MSDSLRFRLAANINHAGIALIIEMGELLHLGTSQLDEVDTSKVEPMTSVVAFPLRQRSDQVTEGEIADQVTKNAPKSEDHYFVVPKVIE